MRCYGGAIIYPSGKYIFEIFFFQLLFFLESFLIFSFKSVLVPSSSHRPLLRRLYRRFIYHPGKLLFLRPGQILTSTHQVS